MSFVSPEFAIWFSIIFITYFLVPKRFRIIYLLLAGYVFYGYRSFWHLLLLIATTLVDFVLALAIARTDKVPQRKTYLVLSIGINLLVLFTFKYLSFFSGIANGLLS